jgi:hypothetical protein
METRKRKQMPSPSDIEICTSDRISFGGNTYNYTIKPDSIGRDRLKVQGYSISKIMKKADEHQHPLDEIRAGVESIVNKKKKKQEQEQEQEPKQEAKHNENVIHAILSDPFVHVFDNETDRLNPENVILINSNANNYFRRIEYKCPDALPKKIVLMGDATVEDYVPFHKTLKIKLSDSLKQDLDVIDTLFRGESKSDPYYRIVNDQGVMFCGLKNDVVLFDVESSSIMSLMDPETTAKLNEASEIRIRMKIIGLNKKSKNIFYLPQIIFIKKLGRKYKNPLAQLLELANK